MDSQRLDLLMYQEMITLNDAVTALTNTLLTDEQKIKFFEEINKASNNRRELLTHPLS